MAGRATSFVSASNSSKYLIPEWLERIHEEYEREEHGRLLDVFGRQAVWNVCRQLGVGTETVAPTACLVLEKYVRVLARKAMADCRRRGSAEEEVWGLHLRAFMFDRLPLLLAAAVQLVAKMSSSAHHITALKVQRFLKRKGFKHTLSQVTQAEFDVFQAVGFRLPLWPSLETAQLLSREAGLPLALLPTVARVVELAELRRPELDREAAGTGCPQIGTLPLCAGAVAAAARLGEAGGDPIPALASFAKSPETFIRLLADLIVAMALEPESEDDSSSSSSDD